MVSPLGKDSLLPERTRAAGPGKLRVEVTSLLHLVPRAPLGWDS